MEQKRIKQIVSLLLTIIFLAACSSPLNPAPTQTTQTQAGATEAATEPAVTSENGAPAAPAGLCTNTYYPIREGATWTYKSTGGPAGEYSFTDTVTSVQEDGFTLSTQMGDLTRTQEWDCTPQGLVALQLGGAPMAMLNSQGIQMNLDVKNSSGVTFPGQINPGDQWQQNLDFEGDVTMSNEEAKATGNAQLSFNAVGTESVTVPAGTFDAMRIDAKVNMKITATYEGITLPVTFSATYTYWFAPNVGWVKATGTGNALVTSFSETTELQSYSIP